MGRRPTRRLPRRGTKEHEITSSRRRVACRLSAVAVVCALALAAVPSAFAHASLVSTNPTAGAVLEAAPSRVVLRFDEGVSAVAGSLRVYDGDARRVDDGRVQRPDEREIAIALPRSLADDTYTVAWRAISADCTRSAGRSSSPSALCAATGAALCGRCSTTTGHRSCTRCS